ncbi:hypothetical protein ACQ27_gp404 [Klebsiella phage K64-1]|nr:hypothetical protein ACQ27_gp404 [Klebsiella phage K64-1]
MSSTTVAKGNLWLPWGVMTEGHYPPYRVTANNSVSWVVANLLK